MDDPDITDDAIVLALKKFGSLRDLPEEFRQVVWVTVYQAREIAVKIELAGGSWGIAKSALRRDGDGDGLKFEQSLIRMEFLSEVIPRIRSSNRADAEFATQLAIDLLKWRMEEAPNMSTLRRAMARRFAKADKAYDTPVPTELTDD